MTTLRLVSVGFPGATEVAAGDRSVPSERRRLTQAFERQLAAGTWAAVPSGDLGGCCRRALPVASLDDVPADAREVRFFRAT